MNSLESYPAVEAFLGDCMQNYGPKSVDLVKVLDYSVIRLSLSSSSDKKEKEKKAKVL